MDARSDMVKQHRAERQKLKDGQASRWMAETKARQDRLNKGLRGVFDRLTGRHSKIKRRNALEAQAGLQRDQGQRDDLVLAQMQDRRFLQKSFDDLRAKHKEDRRILARSIGQALKVHHQQQDRDDRMPGLQRRMRGPDLSP